jgi:hypothetical protein
MSITYITFYNWQTQLFFSFEVCYNGLEAGPWKWRLEIARFNFVFFISSCVVPSISSVLHTNVQGMPFLKKTTLKAFVWWLLIDVR